MKKVARILFYKIRPSQEILKIRDGTPLEAHEILTYIKSPRNGSVCYFSSKLDVPSNVVQKKRVARILFFKIRPSQGILKIRYGTPIEKILTYIKCPRNGSVCYFSSKLYVSSNVVQKKKVARILFFKIKSSQGILKIRDVARILFFKIRPSQKILKIRDGTPLEAISRNLKIRDGTPLEAEGILTYIKSPRNGSICYFSSKLDVPSNVVQKKRVAQLHFFKIRPSQEILKIRDATPLEAEGILTYIKSPRNGSICYFSSNKLDVPSNIVQKKRVARIMFFKIRSSQEIIKIRDGPLEAEGILTYIKSPRNGSICSFSSKLDVPSNVVQKKRVARMMFFKIRPSQEILKIRDATPLEVEGILTYIKALETDRFAISRNLKIRDGTPLEAEGILTYIKSPRNGSICYFSSKLDVPSNVVQKKRVAQLHFLKIRPSQEILKIRDATPLEAEGILTYIKSPRNGSICYFSSKLDVPSNVVQKKRVARIMFFKIRPSQEILKIRDATPLEVEGILTYIKSPRNGSICYFSSKLDVPSNAVHNKRVARILFFKIRQSQEI
ncbi:hypothetical protein OROMI_024962 [Orobanche minor]